MIGAHLQTGDPFRQAEGRILIGELVAIGRDPFRQHPPQGVRRAGEAAVGKALGDGDGGAFRSDRIPLQRPLAVFAIEPDGFVIVALHVADLDGEQPALVGVCANDHRRPDELARSEGLGGAERHERVAEHRPPGARPVNARSQRGRSRDGSGRKTPETLRRIIACAAQAFAEPQARLELIGLGVQRRGLQAGAALQNDPAVEPRRRWRRHQVTGAPGAGAFRKQGDVLGVAPEGRDIGLHPAQRRLLVHQTIVAAGVLARFGKARMGQPAQGAEAEVERHDHPALISRQPRRVVVGPCSDREGAAVQIDHDRQGRVGASRRGVDVQKQAVLGPDDDAAASAQDGAPP